MSPFSRSGIAEQGSRFGMTTSIKTLAIRASYFSGLPRLLANSPETCLTTVVFHRFIYAQELNAKARDRLKRQCEWLRENYTPLTLADGIRAVRGGELPARPLLITIDDALIDLLDFHDIFRAFELPITVFACAGWCADASAADPDTLLARVVNNLEWYNGPHKAIAVNGGSLAIGSSRATKSATIDQLLANKNEWQPYLACVLAQLADATQDDNDRTCCSWDDLSDLKKSGAQIGSHSVSHIKLAEASRIRTTFEIAEAKRILTDKFGSCEAFAYPYGMSDTYNQSTTLALKQAGFDIAFSTVAGFAGVATDPFGVPRIALPDRPLEFAEFCARVGGGGVVLAVAQEFLRRPISRMIPFATKT